MKNKYRTGIQKQVLHLIEYSCDIMKLPYITTEELKKELRQPDETDAQIMHRITQAIYHLKKNNKIIDKGYGKYSVNKSEKKQHQKCRLLTSRGDRPYCPVKRCYIGDPNRQCIAIEGTDNNKMVSIPVCVGYATNKLNVDISVQKLHKEKQEQLMKLRYYGCNQLDPKSKYYLPNLTKESRTNGS